MDPLNEELARTQIAVRLGEARHRQPGHRLVLARRQSRRAERAALQARLVITRSL